MTFNKLWNREILRKPEDEDGGGVVFVTDEGASDADPAPAPQPADRSSKLEDRFNKLEQSISNFMSGQQQKEQSGQAQEVERRIKAAEANSKRAVDDAEAALAEAFDEGDGAVIAKAQRKLSEATAEAKRIEVQAVQVRQQIKDAEKRDGGKRAEGSGDSLDTGNLDSWKTKHSSWYGVDKDMTKAAHEIDAQIRGAGVLEPGSVEYFDAIDRQMKNKYPAQFGGTPPAGGGGGSHAPGNQRQVRIPASVADGYRRMGIDIDDPKVAKRMVKNRERAVAKGWLDEKPAAGRIFNR